MGKALPSNAVRAVVREWLASKNPVFDKLLLAIADSVAPIVAEQATAMLVAALQENSLGEAYRLMLNATRKCETFLQLFADGDSELIGDGDAEALLGEVQIAIAMAQMWLYGHP